MNINLNEKELQIVELMAPGHTAEEIINSVVRSWFNSNLDRLYKTIKPYTEVVDEIIVVNTEKLAQDNQVVKPVVK